MDDPPRPEPELLDHLVLEFGDHGRRAVEFLTSAERLLTYQGADDLRRLPEAIAYCLREALKAIPKSQELDDPAPWRRASRDVTAAKRRYELARGLPDEDENGALDALLAAVDELDAVHDQQGVHERRLIGIVVGRTGTLPLAAGTAPIRAYHNLVGELDQALHGDTTLDAARGLWASSLALLRQLFLPPDIRHTELDALASIQQPNEQHVAMLLPLIVGPNHLRYFLSCLESPAWLDALNDTGLLDPPTENRPWPVFTAVNRLSAEHGQAVATWLAQMYARGGSDETRAFYLAQAAVDLGSAGADLVVQVVRDHPSVGAISSLGVIAAETLDPADELIEALADILLNDASWRSAGYMDPVLNRLIEGMTDGNAHRRLQILAWKFRTVDSSRSPRSWVSHISSGSITDEAYDDPNDHLSGLVRTFTRACSRAVEWVSVADLLAIVESLPDELSARLRALVLATAPGVNVSRVIEELARAMTSRLPTGDDLPLIDRVAAEADPAAYADLWMQSLGPAPSIKSVAEALAAHAVPQDWLRAFEWASLIPSRAIGRWAQPASVIATAAGTPTRERLERRPRLEIAWGQSPMTVEDLSRVEPLRAAELISAWRPDPSEWLVSARELARTLEAAVRVNPCPWINSPLEVVTRLRHPTYIHHFLQATAEVVKSVDLPVAELLDVIALVRAHPWTAEPLGRDDFDFDPNWAGAESAAVDVLKALADANHGFAGRDEEVWEILRFEVLDRESGR